MTGTRPSDSGGSMSEHAPLFSALIVDDHFALREVLARFLARDGWQVTTAGDGVEGLEAVRSRRFDVVITDVHMPRRGGLWLWAEALALRPELRGKFVFMSSEPLPEPPSNAVFMVKPLSLATLQSEVQSIVRSVSPCIPRASAPTRRSKVNATRGGQYSSPRTALSTAMTRSSSDPSGST